MKTRTLATQVSWILILLSSFLAKGCCNRPDAIDILKVVWPTDSGIGPSEALSLSGERLTAVEPRTDAEGEALRFHLRRFPGTGLEFVCQNSAAGLDNLKVWMVLWALRQNQSLEGAECARVILEVENHREESLVAQGASCLLQEYLRDPELGPATREILNSLLSRDHRKLARLYWCTLFDRAERLQWIPMPQLLEYCGECLLRRSGYLVIDEDYSKSLTVGEPTGRSMQLGPKRALARFTSLGLQSVPQLVELLEAESEEARASAQYLLESILVLRLADYGYSWAGTRDAREAAILRLKQLPAYAGQIR
jgi:hypothetical protein